MIDVLGKNGFCMTLATVHYQVSYVSVILMLWCELACFVYW